MGWSKSKTQAKLKSSKRFLWFSHDKEILIKLRKLYISSSEIYLFTLWIGCSPSNLNISCPHDSIFVFSANSILFYVTIRVLCARAIIVASAPTTPPHPHPPALKWGLISCLEWELKIDCQFWCFISFLNIKFPFGSNTSRVKF